VALEEVVARSVFGLWIRVLGGGSRVDDGDGGGGG
jgi:hypothetical protein